jgi:small nuclear ribonucleoprotein (snRNP)-like protein
VEQQTGVYWTMKATKSYLELVNMLALRQIWFRQGRKIRGVLTKFDDDFQLVVRSEQDIKLEGTRAIPFLSKIFNRH